MTGSHIVGPALVKEQKPTISPETRKLKLLLAIHAAKIQLQKSAANSARRKAALEQIRFLEDALTELERGNMNVSMCPRRRVVKNFMKPKPGQIPKTNN